MASKLIDLYNHILRYNDKEVYIAFHSKTLEPYFHANQLCKMLNYENYQVAIDTNVLKSDMFYLKDIVKNYKSLYKNVQGNTKFINESGLYALVLKSRKKEAKEIVEWITHEVMPSIRKYGEYKTNNKIKKQIDELNVTIEKLQDEIGVLKHNLKKPKHKKGGIVYLLRSIENTVKIDEHEIIFMKFGRTKNMKARKPVYDTCTKNRVQILKEILVKDPKNIETCVLKRMEDYRFQNKKEYFESSYNTIIDEIAACIKFYENTDIDKSIEVNELNRLNTNEKFDRDEKVLIKIIDDNEFNELCDDFKENLSDTQSSEEETDDDDVQEGGTANYEYKAAKYKLKYLELKFDLL